MAYFSRLTDIVTCNLSSLLSRCDDAEGALEGIIREMKEGVAGAERCVKTSHANVARLEEEIAEHRAATSKWIARAQDCLKQNNEAPARECLERKHEVEDLIAGLEQQLQAAVGTRDHLQTMLCALQARMADACRRLKELRGECASLSEAAGILPTASLASGTTARPSRVDAELEELRRQLNQG
ncbi:PspA/IM30 family protein [Planctomicrobium piriforme]|uniref:Phage shock protein A n=1 Tax=Planctomicrobium piriforme TaxID=1576369 RepID=A0A1I3F5B3_9PLAN|nr:PspA/IM30 family protein [Planctomicrobium piriforme]SFI05971.1 phage shock protein A [Planctomicrobium piriforme]